MMRPCGVRGKNILHGGPVCVHAQLCVYQMLYHTHASCRGVNGEALQLHAVYKSRISYYKSRKNSYQVLQVTRESVSSITSHARIRIKYYKSRENPYQVLQVTREFVSSITSHVRIRIKYYKSRENSYQVLQVTCVHLNVQ